MKSKSILSLTGLIWFIMLFSDAQAQSAGERAAANGLAITKPLVVGNKVPEEFWTKEHLFFINGDTVRKSLSALKGKALVLDFWYIGCSACMRPLRKIQNLKPLYEGDMHVLMVNNLPNFNNVERFQKFYADKEFEKFGMEGVNTVIYDSYLYDLFGSLGYPLYIWINKEGMVRIISNTDLFHEDFLRAFIGRERI